MKSLRPLQMLLEVARAGSIRRAADSLEISQPAVSVGDRGVGREVGTPLLEREGRGVRLTPAGEAYVAYGRRAMALLAEARDAASAMAGGASALRVAAVTTAAESFVPRLLGGFLERVPGIEIELDVSNRAQIWDRLTHGEVELVVAGKPPVTPRCRTLAWRANELVVVCGPQQALGAQGLAGATWLMREVGSGTRSRTEELFALLGIAPRVLTIGSNGAVRECVRAGLGVSVLSTDAVGEDLAAGRLRAIPTAATPQRRNWQLVTAADRVLSRQARAFVAFATASGAFAAGEPPDLA